MLGQYEKFPQIVHGIGNFTYRFLARDLQQVIIQVFYGLNRETYEFSGITHLPSSSQCQVGFEVGIAEGISFNFLDDEELERLRESVQRDALSFLDFICVARYHVLKAGGKKVPLKFDHYFLRFAFHQRDLELRIVHERRTQHIHLEDLVNFVVKQINSELAKNGLEPLGKRYLRTL